MTVIEHVPQDAHAWCGRRRRGGRGSHNVGCLREGSEITMGKRKHASARVPGCGAAMHCARYRWTLIQAGVNSSRSPGCTCAWRAVPAGNSMTECARKHAEMRPGGTLCRTFSTRLLRSR